METTRSGILAVLAAVALTAQLAVVPMQTAGHESALQWLLALATVAIAIGSFVLSRTHQRLASGMLLLGVPSCLGLFALTCIWTPLPRFDLGARWIASMTAVGFFYLAITWFQLLQPRRVTHPHETAPGATDVVNEGPPLRRAAIWLLAILAWTVAAVLPVIASQDGPHGRTEIQAGERMVRARESVTTAGGFLIAIVVIFAAGSPLLRRKSTPPGRAARGLAFLVWAVAIAGLKLLLDRAK